MRQMFFKEERIFCIIPCLKKATSVTRLKRGEVVTEFCNTWIHVMKSRLLPPFLSKHEKKRGKCWQFSSSFSFVAKHGSLPNMAEFFFLCEIWHFASNFFQCFFMLVSLPILLNFFLIFQAFFPSTLDSIQQIHSSSSVKHNNQWNNDGIKYWVPTKHEANQALRVPSEPIISSQVSNEIEFQKSNELLIPGKPKNFSRFFF